MNRSAINYRVEVADLHAHLFHVTLTLPQPQREQIVSLPVWIPGSYLVREFSKHLQNLRAHQGDHALVVRPLDKARWQIHCQPASDTPLSSPLPLVLQYQVFAHDASVRAAFLDATRGFFNGTSVLLRAEGHEASPCVLEVVRNEAIADMAQWSVATGAQALEIDANGFGFYEAEDYDELVDCPFEMGTFWSGTFTACGIPHRFVVAGAPTGFDGTCLLADTQTICEAEIRFWHGDKDGENSKPPFENYVFLLNAVADGYGGLEHRNSTALMCKRLDLVPNLSKSEGYTQLLGLISHEYFHTWNVKRLRPAEFAQYDYAQENYTQLLWFFEGFTSYYGDLFLRRTGLMDETSYLQTLAKAMNNVAQTPGRMVEAVAQSSFNAWIKYYRFDSNTPNATVNYYTKGALVALCLDLTLRKEKQTTLDDVMRGLWQRCMNHPVSGAMTEHDLQAVLHQLGGRLFTSELAHWVHGTSELPVTELLQQHGVACKPATNPPSLAQQLGLRVSERNNTVHITHVLRGSAAEQAGFSSGDEWVAVQGAWRIHSMDDVSLYKGTESTISVLVARDQRLLQLQLTIPATPVNHSISLYVSDAASAHAWLESPPLNEKELSQ